MVYWLPCELSNLLIFYQLQCGKHGTKLVVYGSAIHIPQLQHNSFSFSGKLQHRLIKI